MEPAVREPVSSTYHVFINHRGPDVKKTLASLIYHRLRSCGLRVFLDKKELHTGDALSPAIFGAIQSASVHIAIFSERYAESRWCLDELCSILAKSDRKIIPVFYDVEPTDLRYIDNESGRYRKAFEEYEHKGRVTMEDIKKWKTALNKAAGISGTLFKTNESDHGEVLEEIVKAVLKEVKWEPFEVAKYPVGLDQAVKEINDEIQKQSEVNGATIVGIAGMAGLGKSTLATYLYNLKRSDYSRSCFLSGSRENDLLSLQRELLRDLLGCDFHIKDDRQGKAIFRDRLRGLQVLIVLDDADRIKQIDNLLVTDVVGSRSLILITSRDQALLRCFSPKTVVYNVRPLQGKHAHELFCWHAFHQSEPCEGFEHLVEAALKICGGLPLSLQVLGGQFFGQREEEYWKRQLEKLSRRLPDNILDKLKVSYEALNSEEKEIFLDLGCFFLGEEKELAVRVFEGLGYKDVCDCLENLRQKCLIEFHDDVQSDDEIKCRREEPIDGFLCCNLCLQMTTHDSNDDYDYLYLPKRDKIAMHDHIRHLARHIAREEYGVLPPRKSLRLSCSNDIEELMLKLQGGADCCLIRGIRTAKGQNLPDCTNYVKGVGVRLFVVEVPLDLSSAFGLWYLSGDLVWLRMRSFRSIFFPDTISLRNLRVLELEGHGDLEQLFQRFNLPPRKLSVLNIDVKGTQPRPFLNPSGYPTGTKGRARRTPRRHNRVKSGASTSISSLDLNDSEITSDSAQEGFRASYLFRFLEWIGTSIKFPSKIVLKNITFLQSLPIGFGELKSLGHLDLSGCTNLTQLPKSFSELMHLQYLVLRDCIKLAIPKDILGNMSSLEYVDFKGCCKLKYLPTGIENQKSLRYLNLLYTDLKWPMKLKLPEKLQRLRIGNLRSAIEFHSGREHLQGTKLRQSLGDLRRLKELKELILIDFDGPGGILWEKIAGPNVKVLVIRGCPIDIFSFKEQGTIHVGMSALRDFTLSNTQITEICIPEGVLPSLETLDLSKNRQLMQVKGLPSTLVRLNLQGCSRLKALINLSNLLDLKFLCINGCDKLETLNVEGLTSLEEIQAEACPQLRSIHGLSQPERLKYLRISTHTDVIWNDICNFLTSTSHDMLSTAFFTGKSTITRWDRAFYEMVMREMQSITEQFYLKVVNVVFPATPDDFLPATPDDFLETSLEFHTKMKGFQSYGGILMFFLTGSDEPDLFRVRFEASNDGRSADEYTVRGGKQIDGGLKLHVLMWTEECNLFRDEKGYNSIRVSYNWGPSSDKVDVKKGWIIMVDRNIDVSQVCKQIIMALPLEKN